MKEKPHTIVVLKSRQTGKTFLSHQEWVLNALDKTIIPPFLFRVTKKNLIEKINTNYY